MTSKHLFVFDTVVAGVFGFGLLVIPNPVLALFGIGDPTDGAQTLLARLLGGALVGIGAAEWLARNLERAGALPLLRGVLFFDVLAVIVSAEASLAGTVNGLGWLVVGLFAFFGAARVALGFKSVPKS